MFCSFALKLARKRLQLLYISNRETAVSLCVFRNLGRADAHRCAYLPPWQVFTRWDAAGVASRGWPVSYCCRWWSGRSPRWPITEVPWLLRWAAASLPTCFPATIIKSSHRLVWFLPYFHRGRALINKSFQHSVTTCGRFKSMQKWEEGPKSDVEILPSYIFSRNLYATCEHIVCGAADISYTSEMWLCRNWHYNINIWNVVKSACEET